MKNILIIKKIFLITFFLFIFLVLISASDLFTTIKNPWGAGFYVINTATGQVSLVTFIDKNHGKQEYIGIIEKSNTISGKYLPCINENNKSAFLLDSESGELYTFNTNKNSLAKAEMKNKLVKNKIGTYIPVLNKDGSGLFIFNSSNGECYWTHNGIELQPFLLSTE